MINSFVNANTQSHWMMNSWLWVSEIAVLHFSGALDPKCLSIRIWDLSNHSNDFNETRQVDREDIKLFVVAELFFPKKIFL